MFCPKCGERLVERSGRLYCVRGHMEIPTELGEGLRERFGPGGPPRSGVTGELWYCPKCTTRMREQDGDVSCPRGCGSLNAFLDELVPLSHVFGCG